jgi:polyisoprenyl-teichoic acid--peptidoglycan teichoic acid transferase
MPLRKNKQHQPDRNVQDTMLNMSIPNPAYQSTLHGARREHVAMEAERKARRSKLKKRIMLALAGLLVLAGLWVGWKFLSNSAKIFGWDDLLGLFSNTKLKGEDDGHVTILLAGNSADDAGHGGAQLTDSIMILSINTKQHTAFMMSVPRDLYVNIPDHGYAKINEAYQDGEADNFSESGYADGGMGLLQKVIAQNFGVDFQYYALVNYSALRDAVNAVGGIAVNIASSDPRGLYDPSRDLTTGQPLVNLPNGPQKLNGQQALNLARARGHAYGSYGFARSDFDRTAHQQQILLGLKEKASSAGTLSNPVKVGQLFDSLGNNVKTDMKLVEVKRLYTITKKIPNADITSATLNNGKDIQLLQSYQTRLGQSALVPAAGIDDYSAIQAYVRELLDKQSTITNSSN